MNRKLMEWKGKGKGRKEQQKSHNLRYTHFLWPRQVSTITNKFPLQERIYNKNNCFDNSPFGIFVELFAMMPRLCVFETICARMQLTWRHRCVRGRSLKRTWCRGSWRAGHQTATASFYANKTWFKEKTFFLRHKRKTKYFSFNKHEGKILKWSRFSSLGLVLRMICSWWLRRARIVYVPR